MAQGKGGTSGPAAKAAAPPPARRSLEEAQRRHETAAAELQALYADTAFIEETRRAIADADAHGTAHWPTLDDLARAFDLDDGSTVENAAAAAAPGQGDVTTTPAARPAR